jgi:hypothetical protein
LKFVVEKERDKWLAEINNILSDEMFAHNAEDNPLARSMTLRGSTYARRKDTMSSTMVEQANMTEENKNFPLPTELTGVSLRKKKDKSSEKKQKPNLKDVIEIK